MSITKCSSKIQKPTLYDKSINNPIRRQCWKEAIEAELQNLENHQIFKYNELLPGQKTIGSKWVFKVKYQPDDSVARFKAKLVA